MPRRTIAGARAIVTGASSGIGRELALELARHGARLLVTARRLERLESLVKEIHGLDREAFRVLSPEPRAARSTLVLITHRDSDRNAQIHRKLAEDGIDVALRKGSLRVSPHLYNTTNDIDRLLGVLASP